MRETDLLEPNSYYAVAKGAQTLLCQHVAKAERRPITTFRLFSVYGPFEEPSRLIPTLVRLCLEGRNLTLVDPETARDFVYIDDVVDAYLRIDKLAGLCGEVMNIGTGVQRTLAPVGDTVLRETGAQARTRQPRWGRARAPCERPRCAWRTTARHPTSAPRSHAPTSWWRSTFTPCASTRRRPAIRTSSS